MKKDSRVVACNDFSLTGMHKWFGRLARQNLLFHPDDDPATIVSISTGNRTFSAREIMILRISLRKMFMASGTLVYEAAYPLFMASMKVRRSNG